MTNLTVVPDPEGPDDHPEFEELMRITQRLIVSAISKIDWADAVQPIAEHLVTDPEDAKVIARLAEQVVIDVYFAVDEEGA